MECISIFPCLYEYSIATRKIPINERFKCYKDSMEKNSKKNFQTPLIMGAQNTRSTHVFASRKQVPLVNFVGMPLQRMLSLTKLLFVSRPTFASPQQIRHKSPPSFQQEKYPLCLDKPLFQLI